MEPPKKPARGIVRFEDAQSAIDGTLETWLPRLVESNDALVEALLLLRDLYSGRNGVAEDVVLKRVEEALGKAAMAKSASPLHTVHRDSASDYAGKMASAYAKKWGTFSLPQIGRSEPVHAHPV
jgi:hypothetical protein